MNIHKIIGIMVFFSLVITVVFATRNSGAQEQNQQAYDVACEVGDVASFKDCVQKAKNKEVDLIKITKIVECTSKEDCSADFSNLEHPIKIYGVNNVSTGFRRIGNFDYTIFTIQNVKDFVIGSFVIEDTGDGNCTTLGTPCPPAIIVTNTANSMIDQLRTVNVKNTGLLIQASSGITVKNSVFENSQNHALVVTNGTGQSRNILLDTNTFTGTSSNAVVFASSGEGNVMQNNIFERNHSQALYDGCVGVCVGAQIRIMPNTGNLSLLKNTIRNGSITTYNALGLYASGIEIAGAGVESVTMSCNRIYSNSGNGVVIPNRTTATKQVIMKQNAVYDNGINTNFILGPQDQVENNCFEGGCTVSGC